MFRALISNLCGLAWSLLLVLVLASRVFSWFHFSSLRNNFQIRSGIRGPQTICESLTSKCCPCSQSWFPFYFHVAACIQALDFLGNVAKHCPMQHPFEVFSNSFMSSSKNCNVTTTNWKWSAALHSAWTNAINPNPHWNAFNRVWSTNQNIVLNEWQCCDGMLWKNNMPGLCNQSWLHALDGIREFIKVDCLALINCSKPSWRGKLFKSLLEEPHFHIGHICHRLWCHWPWIVPCLSLQYLWCKLGSGKI